jgi:hypothetical protein
MAIRIRRREFIVTLGGAAAWPLAARAQQPGRTYRIGFLIRAPRNTPFADAAFDELRVNGFIDGQNLIVLPGGFDDPNEVMAERATALVKAGPDVIIAGPDGPIRALQAATQTVPIVGMTEDMSRRDWCHRWRIQGVIRPELVCSRQSSMESDRIF